MRLFAICAVLAASLVGFGATSASATPVLPLCAQVIIEGEWFTQPTTVGDCPGVPQPGTLCHWEQPGAKPQVYVYTDVCVPDPLTAP